MPWKMPTRYALRSHKKTFAYLHQGLDFTGGRFILYQRLGSAGKARVYLILCMSSDHLARWGYLSPVAIKPDEHSTQVVAA
jgi:hypothetical protein